jgi:DNA-binding response OmpR family regulator
MTQQPAHILIVDDDPALRELLQRYLGEQGLRVAGVADGEGMDQYLRDQAADLIILDLMLPGEDGLSIARRLLGSHDIPILMLSARGEDVDRIVGLEIGADDYLAKPFNPRELLARIRAILRRRHQEPASTPGDDRVHRFGDCRLDLGSQTLTRAGKRVTLTSGELSLLKIFVEHPNRVLSRDTLVDMLSGYERSPYDRSIDVRVARLRRKLESDPADPVYIQTIWGEGYRFSPGMSV